jgi:hypothetical protein
MFIHNFCTEIVGHNQIAEVFNPEYKQVINIHGYDQIQQYNIQPGDYERDNEAEAELFEELLGIRNPNSMIITIFSPNNNCY